jgi:hypothetical protein
MGLLRWFSAHWFEFFQTVGIVGRRRFVALIQLSLGRLLLSRACVCFTGQKRIENQSQMETGQISHRLIIALFPPRTVSLAKLKVNWRTSNWYMLIARSAIVPSARCFQKRFASSLHLSQWNFSHSKSFSSSDMPDSTLITFEASATGVLSSQLRGNCSLVTNSL